MFILFPYRVSSWYTCNLELARMNLCIKIVRKSKKSLYWPFRRDHTMIHTRGSPEAKFQSRICYTFCSLGIFSLYLCISECHQVNRGSLSGFDLLGLGQKFRFGVFDSHDAHSWVYEFWYFASHSLSMFKEKEQEVWKFVLVWIHESEIYLQVNGKEKLRLFECSVHSPGVERSVWRRKTVVRLCFRSLHGSSLCLNNVLF